ncbi:MAG: hypothetical protein Q7J70_00005, partial [Thermodesulfovibrionales bacterium]|nr:hypothetical protein [Thermodesulfovibrionales bacterium]
PKNASLTIIKKGNPIAINRLYSSANVNSKRRKKERYREMIIIRISERIKKRERLNKEGYNRF